MTFNRAAWASAGTAMADVPRFSDMADYERARDFATECWRRALRQRAQTPAGVEG